MKNLFSESLRSKKGVIAFAGIVVFAAALGVYFYESTKIEVALTLNGKQKVVRTHADTVRSLLNEQHVSFSPKDYVFPKANAKLKNHLNIVWKQARQVEIVKDNEKKTVFTTAATVADLLKEQNIVLHSRDQVIPKPFQPIKEKMIVHLLMAKPLTLVDDGVQRKVWSTSTTVADFLKQQGIHLNYLDRVEPAMDKVIKVNDIIHVIRVKKVTDVVEEPVQYAVVSKLDPNLEKGSEKTLVDGVYGVTTKEYEVITENGKEVVRRLVNSMMSKPKQDKIVAVGTKEVTHQDSPGQSFYVHATAYTANCSGCSGNTATGLNLRANPNAKVIAVDPRVIPLGAKVYVDGYGYAVAADTGGAIKGCKIDVFFSSKSDAFRWGRRNVKVTILN